MAVSRWDLPPGPAPVASTGVVNHQSTICTAVAVVKYDARRDV
jgi:hypothetical protein